jgi:hypothetical protein
MFRDQDGLALAQSTAYVQICAATECVRVPNRAM